MVQVDNDDMVSNLGYHISNWPETHGLKDEALCWVGLKDLTIHWHKVSLIEIFVWFRGCKKIAITLIHFWSYNSLFFVKIMFAHTWHSYDLHRCPRTSSISGLLLLSFFMLAPKSNAISAAQPIARATARSSSSSARTTPRRWWVTCASMTKEKLPSRYVAQSSIRLALMCLDISACARRRCLCWPTFIMLLSELMGLQMCSSFGLPCTDAYCCGRYWMSHRARLTVQQQSLGDLIKRYHRH